MKLKGYNLLAILLLTLTLSKYSKQAMVQELELTKFLIKFFENEQFETCLLQFFISQSHAEVPFVSTKWSDRITLLMGRVAVVQQQKSLNTNGIVISQIRTNNNTIYKPYQQPDKIWHSKRCSVVVIIVVNQLNFSVIDDETIKNLLSSPHLYPPTIRNRDKYLILSDQHITHNIQNSKFVKRLKYKLVLVVKALSKKFTSQSLYWTSPSAQLLQVSVMRLCQYGLCDQQSTSVNIPNDVLMKSKYEHSDINSLFPDYERNFFGYALRLSTTTKVPQLLELDTLKDANGQTLVVPKRGLYATVLAELSCRLNFTYIIVPSSGGGSTGHALPNGTWVGIVGDTYHGIVDFGFMAAITFLRFPYAEFCAPINFAYLGFVTGPPRKSYAWNAIMWPFSPVTWLYLTGFILVSSKLIAYFSRVSPNVNSFMNKKKKWEYFKGMAYLLRTLLEQCPDLRNNSTQISFKTFIIFWLTFCLVISTAYRSKMVSILTFPSYDHIPGSFDELALAKDFAIDFHYFGNVGFTFFKTSTNPSFMKIYQRMGREPSPLKCMERTLKEKATCIIFIVSFEELLHRNLSDQYGKSPLKFTRHEGAMFPAGVIHEYKAPLSSNFKSVLLPALETGLVPFWQQTDLNQVLQNKNQWKKANNIDSAIWDSDVSDSLLRVRNLKGAFGILILGMIVAIFLFAVENAKRHKCANM